MKVSVLIAAILTLLTTVALAWELQCDWVAKCVVVDGIETCTGVQRCESPGK